MAVTLCPFQISASYLSHRGSTILTFVIGISCFSSQFYYLHNCKQYGLVSTLLELYVNESYYICLGFASFT